MKILYILIFVLFIGCAERPSTYIEFPKSGTVIETLIDISDYFMIKQLQFKLYYI